jgi:hypothetical protein
MDTKILIAVIIILIVVLLFFGAREYASDVFYLDQIAMHSQDPMNIKYLGRVRDWRGMSPKDYYVENDMNGKNYAAPEYLAKDDAFKNQSNLGPKPLGHYFQTVVVSDD